MTRSPLSYPLNRGADFEAGGAADLQTDVMRFMAILSLCLVAIFALVQSIPLAPQAPIPEPVSDPSPDPTPLPVPEPIAAPTPVSKPERPVPREPEPQPIRLPPSPAYEAPPSPKQAEPIPLASPVAPVPEPAPAPAAQPPAEEGFTLRFESDLALRRLVARNEIGLYAIQPDKALRMNVNRGAMSFWPASLPGQFHEMDASTVPDDVVTALGRAGASGSTKWGVTLPTRLSRELNRYLNEYSGGALIIDGGGTMRLER